jgi:hypothetical protein
MRIILLLLILLVASSLASGQLVITPGAQFYTTGNAQVTLRNTSLVNNGSFVVANSTFTFSGTANSTISGSQPVQFHELEINKDPGSSLILQRNVNVSHRVVFTSGLIHLGTFNLDLGTTGLLHGEKETSRVHGSSGGYIVLNTSLNAPASANPGNLGAIITSAQNLGSVTIRRGHQSQTNAAGLGTSIYRHYDILPTNTGALNATLRMHYFDAELNGLNENTLVAYKNDDGTNWVPQGYSARNTTTNYVERNGINTFRSWTLSSAGNALPLQFVLFNVKCEGSKTLITWKTAQEQNTARFDVQSSADGVQWTVAGSVPAAGNSSAEKSYSYTDNNTKNTYYRIAGYDIDGKMHYTSVLRSPCGSKDMLRLWPNPAQRTVYINIVAGESSTAIIKIFDHKGSLVKQQQTAVLRGSNQFSIDVATLPAGAYALTAEWNNGQMKHTTQVLKQ